ncbi:TraR/DksA C4-type zinc finger protein [Roseovarius sp. SCSIO 43702]|uniref:TraR/DksA family transcriptional regulator n=1 Tax=Roseovarius sp. SCSIO 43702 TaxID=2823043 RepID=UPI001C73D106|nr:TraR/DksA C4-type zinc finger protein [Roseovarius sp. SCSIO 43702]QYX56713.1 TraR/DksA C4-type zinc finger protein [Roseovarius sp. SCSIO 43702]
MNDASAGHFRALIAARLAALEHEDALGQDAQATVQLDQQSVGRLSRMDALQGQAMAKASAARRDTERRRLTAALRRLDEGEFGFCEDCGDEIAPARLEFDPAAQKCIACAKG